MRQKANSFGLSYSALKNLTYLTKRYPSIGAQEDCQFMFFHLSFHRTHTMAMNGIQARVPLGDQTNHQDAPTVVIEPRDGDLAVWSKGATKIVKAPYDLVLARGSTFY